LNIKELEEECIVRVKMEKRKDNVIYLLKKILIDFF